MTFVSQCEFRLKSPELEPAFIRVAKALAATAAKEPGTLRYQWFVPQRPGHFTILEEYVDADAAEAHNHNVHALLVEAFALVDLVSVSLYGELNAYLREWVTARDGVTVNRPL